MKQYYIRSWGFSIEEREVIRKSESSIWFIYNAIAISK